MHAFYMCFDKNKKALLIMDHANFGKISSSEPKIFMEKIKRMDNPEIYTIGAAYSGKSDHKSYIKVPKIVPAMRKR